MDNLYEIIIFLFYAAFDFFFKELNLIEWIVLFFDDQKC
jgi:hypothetical protein